MRFGCMPWYIVFAGVNGAGKSTFYRSGLWKTGSEPRHLERVNPDEIVVESGGSWLTQAVFDEKVWTSSS